MPLSWRNSESGDSDGSRDISAWFRDEVSVVLTRVLDHCGKRVAVRNSILDFYPVLNARCPDLRPTENAPVRTVTLTDTDSREWQAGGREARAHVGFLWVPLMQHNTDKFPQCRLADWVNSPHLGSILAGDQPRMPLSGENRPQAWSEDHWSGHGRLLFSSSRCKEIG